MITAHCEECALAWIGEMQTAFDLGWNVTFSDKGRKVTWLCPTHNKPKPLPFKTESLKHDKKGRAAAKYFSNRMDEETETKLLEMAKEGEAPLSTIVGTWRERIWKAVVGFVRMR